MLSVYAARHGTTRNARIWPNVIRTIHILKASYAICSSATNQHVVGTMRSSNNYIYYIYLINHWILLHLLASYCWCSHPEALWAWHDFKRTMAHLQISAKSPQEGAKNADPWHKARSKQNPEFESKWRCATKCYVVLVTVNVYGYIMIYMWWLESVPFSLLGTECRPSFSSLAADHSPNMS